MYWAMVVQFGLLKLIPPPHAHSTLPGLRFFASKGTLHRTHNFSGFTFLHPAFDFDLGKKQPASGVGHLGSRYPTVVLEVGDSESLAQLKIDAKSWLEGPPQVCQFLPLSPPLNRTHFRHDS